MLISGIPAKKKEIFSKLQVNLAPGTNLSDPAACASKKKKKREREKKKSEAG